MPFVTQKSVTGIAKDYRTAFPLFYFAELQNLPISHLAELEFSEMFNVFFWQMLTKIWGIIILGRAVMDYLSLLND